MFQPGQGRRNACRGIVVEFRKPLGKRPISIFINVAATSTINYNGNIFVTIVRSVSLDGLIRPEFFYMVDHQHVDGFFARFQFEGELFFDALEDADVVEFGLALAIGAHVGGVGELDAVGPGKSRMIDDGAIEERVADGVHYITHRRFLESDHVVATFPTVKTHHVRIGRSL